MTMTTSPSPPVDASAGCRCGHAKPLLTHCAIARCQRECSGACGRSCCLRAPGSWNGNDNRRDVEHPGERDLVRARAALSCNGDESSASCETTRSARAAQRRVRDQRDSALLAELDKPSPHRGVIEHAQRNLDGRDLGHVKRLFELAAVHVGDPDIANQPLALQLGERADGGPPGCTRVRGVDQVQVDGNSVEGGETRFAIGANRPGATVGNPQIAGAGHAAFGDDARALLDARTSQRVGRAVARSLPGRPGPAHMRVRCRRSRSRHPQRHQSSPTRSPGHARYWLGGACNQGRPGDRRRGAMSGCSGCRAYVTRRVGHPAPCAILMVWRITLPRTTSRRSPPTPSTASLLTCAPAWRPTTS